MEIEADPIHLLVLHSVEFFKENSGDVGKIADQVRFAVNNGFQRVERGLPEGIEGHLAQCESVNTPGSNSS